MRGNDEDENAGTGGQAGGPALEEALLEPAMELVGVVGRIEEEQGGAVARFLGAGDGEVKGVAVEVVAGEEPAGELRVADRLELDAKDLACDRRIFRILVGKPEPAERLDRVALAGAGVDEDVVASIAGQRPELNQRRDAREELRRRREVAGERLRLGPCHGRSPVLSEGAARSVRRGRPRRRDGWR